MTEIQAIDRISRLEGGGELTQTEWKELFEYWNEKRGHKVLDFASSRARKVCDDVFGKKVYIRGLIEFTSYCRNDCYYCGLRKSNHEAERYRLDRKRFWTAAE